MHINELTFSQKDMEFLHNFQLSLPKQSLFPARLIWIDKPTRLRLRVVTKPTQKGPRINLNTRTLVEEVLAELDEEEAASVPTLTEVSRSELEGSPRAQRTADDEEGEALKESIIEGLKKI